MPRRSLIFGIMPSNPFKTRPALSALVFLLFVGLTAQPVKLFAAGEVAPITAGNTAFALDLYGQLKTTEGNLFFSPYSISTCLAMTYAGAHGDTETQMSRTLHFDTNQTTFHTAFGVLQDQLNAIQQKKDIQLNVANGLWAQKGHPFLAPFLKIATKSYDAKLNQVDFRTGAEPARKDINDWVSDRTQGKITGLIGPGVLNGMTRLVLVNAIYFKGKWIHQFKKSRTLDAPFSVSSDKTTRVKMMNVSAGFKYAEKGDLQLLELPYMGNDVSMVVLLPKEKDGLPELENSVSQEQLQDWLAQGHNQEVNVFLPRFKLTQQFALSHTLAGMGMPDAFSARADFSGMDGGHDLYISAVIHKAFVEVNEEGTEAAAATAVTVRSMAMQRPRPTPVFRADHPFLFLIRDTHSGSILFLGRVRNPAV
jgi:serpin B